MFTNEIDTDKFNHMNTKTEISTGLSFERRINKN